MKKIAAYIFAIAAALTVSSCHDDVEGQQESGMGRLVLTVGMNQTRAAFDPAAECTVKVYNGEGLIYRWDGVDNIPAEQWLTVDNYTIKVASGTEESVAFDAPYYAGESEFAIEAGKTTTVTVNCDEQHALVSVAFAEGMDELFSSYKVSVAAQAGSLDFDATTLDKVGYYSLAEGESSLTWSFTGTKADGSTFTKTGTVADVEAARKHNLTFNYVMREGYLQFDIDVDLTTEDISSEIVIYQKPVFEGVGFDLAQSHEYAGGSYTVEVRTAADITSLDVSGSSFVSMGLSSTTLSLLDAGTAAELAAKGITAEKLSTRKARVTFGDTFLSKLPQGENILTLTAGDGKSSGNSASLTVVMPVTSPVTITSDAVNANGIWATSAAVSARYSGGDGTGTPRFRYRAKGTDAWSYAEATEGESNTFSAELTSLTPATVYEFQGMVGNIAGESTEFTTEVAPALPHGDFETWSTQYHPYSDSERYWDVADPIKNTTYSSDTRPGSNGQYSVEMKSILYNAVIMKQFAAGNIYMGKYGNITMSPMGAKIYFGRPFTGRPKALKGWYKYTAGTVNQVNDKNPDGLTNGDTDRAIIYLALGDWTPDEDNGADSQTPIAIITTTSLSGIQLFDPNSLSVIAYGEKVETKTVGEWTEFTIPIDYRTTDRKPTHIVLTASASKNGDYFTGSTDSVLMLDDLELVY